MRKGFLASLALALGHSVAQAQYPAPYYPAPNYPAANYAPVWVAPPAQHHQVQRPVYPAAPQGFVPQQYAPQFAPHAAQYAPQYGTPQFAAPQYVPQNFVPPVYPQQNYGHQVQSPNYLPQGYFPAQARTTPAVTATIVREAGSTPVPPEPTPSKGSTTTLHARTVARPAVSSGPYGLFDIMPATVAESPREPIVYHRQCNDRGYIGLDYMLAWIDQGPLGAPLVTTGNPLDANPGALGQPGTIVLFGNEKIDYRMHHGLRAEVGYFLDDEGRSSVDIGGFYLWPRHVRFKVQSDDNGLPLLGRPIQNVAEGDEDVFSVSFPIVDDENPVLIRGRTTIDARTQILGGEVNGRYHSYRGRRLHTEMLVGFRTIYFEETLRIRDDVQPLTEDSGLSFKGLAVAAGEVITDVDRFLCYNQFYGFQVGGGAKWEQEKFFLHVLGKVGLGVTDQRVRVEGFSTLTSPLGNQITPGGILALPSNMGEHNRQVFGVVPEIAINMGADITNNLRVKAGYALMVWNGVTRPGAQIDRSINPSQVPTDQDFATVSGAPRPSFQFREEVFFLQSLNFGVEFHF